ncbi:MAG: polyhydroxyalkanoate synthesis repressor PhaR [Pseudomonadales bacterium]|nr:polyhydroxyalkanoate synthesis repressor PhaR [Pseudomonadales bacterium]MBO6656941.1 polyhydroxyalkanoate synthesis repressor PhaR [Pseudomonadales bacterium]MBO6704182.1 polyhydroxyalkanoate synthesis repressor PhaR [Pseudomonadales bacterium]MBO7006011.1 polyhydroxyalkanoate synthesis repressor PhaR [Pseudomonadales bacterium]
MRAFKKYPNRRLYDIEESKYVTVEDIRKIILNGESISVVDSKTEKDLTRTVLMQIISEQEGEGHEPILTNRVLEQLIRFYGDAMQSIVGRYIEQSIMTFLEHQDRYQRSVRDLTSGDPLKLMRNAMEQNMEFWNRMAGSALRPERAQQERPRETAPDGASDINQADKN